MIAYGSMFVIAQAIQATGCDPSRAKFISGWENLKDAGPTKMGGLDVFFNESYTPTDHQGNYRLGAAIVRNGEWQVYRVLEKP
jgi:branched-chain amino acid transport system substrate-binding protein